MKTPEDTYEYHDDPKLADGDNPNGIPHWLVAQPKYRSSKIITRKNLGKCR
jgi:hypothetical protein